MDIKFDINFHQTFKPEKNYISELLQVAEDVSSMTLEELSVLTGIPQGKSSGKLVPHLKYAYAMGVIEYNLRNSLYSMNLTDLGRHVLEEDPGLAEDVTLLILHSNLVNRKLDIQPWNFCFEEYITRYGKSSKYSYFKSEVERKFGKKVKYGPFLKTYEEMFHSLGLLDVRSECPEDENSMVFTSFSWTREFLPAIGYIFYELWEKCYPNEQEISSDQIDEMNFRNLFAWSTTEELEVLDALSEYGLIRVNKQLMPYTVIRLKDKQDITDNLYSELL